MATEEQKEKETIIIAVDQSDEAEAAFNFYVCNLHRPGHRVILVHSMEIPRSKSGESVWYMTKEQYADMVDTVKAQAKKTHDHYTKLLTDKDITTFETQSLSGPKPGENIVKCANDNNATIIVMGARGMSKLRRTLIGGVSNYVMKHAQCPVLVGGHRAVTG